MGIGGLVFGLNLALSAYDLSLKDFGLPILSLLSLVSGCSVFWFLPF
jgi:hypothetical protein